MLNIQKFASIQNALFQGLRKNPRLNFNFAYKDINAVIDAVAQAGISKPVVGLKPIGNIKG